MLSTTQAMQGRKFSQPGACLLAYVCTFHPYCWAMSWTSASVTMRVRIDCLARADCTLHFRCNRASSRFFGPELQMKASSDLVFSSLHGGVLASNISSALTLTFYEISRSGVTYSSISSRLCMITLDCRSIFNCIAKTTLPELARRGQREPGCNHTN